MRELDWQNDARCVTDSEVQEELRRRYDRFTDGPPEVAIYFCQDCPVIAQCLELALDLHSKATSEEAKPHGVWGGTTRRERGWILTKRIREQKRIRQEAELMIKQMREQFQGIDIPNAS